MRRLLFLASALGLLALTGRAQVTAVQLTVSISPAALFVNQEGTITLRLATGQAGERPPADLFLVVDRSATANVREMERIGSSIIEALAPQDRVGLVSFGTDARVDVPLTFDHEAVRQGLKLLRPLGKTAVGEGIAKALDTLVINGREEASWAMVLISDGRSNIGRTPLSQAQRAAENGVVIFTIATGRTPDRTLLRELARLTQGRFFEQFADTVPREIAQALGRKILARQIKITLVLPAFLSYGVATFNAPNRVTKNPDNTTTLLWELESLLAGESWEASFTVLAAQAGTASLQPSFSYVDARGRLVTPSVSPISLRVRERNRPPTVSFDFAPAEPKANEPIAFVDRSTDDVGIVAWEWSFGDGNSSSEQNPTHRYRADGSYTVTLTVTDTDGEKASATKSIKVFTPRATVTRTIDTNLPNDETIPGERVKVKIVIQALDRINGLVVLERFPSDLTFKLLSTESGTARPGQGEVLWVFLEALDPGLVRTIEYELTIPETPAPDKPPEARVIKLSGSISSASPAFEYTITGEAEIKVVTKLPFPVIFARMDVSDAANPKVNLWLETTTISFEQIQAAVSFFWIPNKEVRNKNGAEEGKINFGRIDIRTLQILVAYWLTGASVFGPLP
ncbi:MAG: PKD domain-containing protein [Candidatus Bipolaricaulota bacterium]|nr:PKD domain-containing protein [Candidatus Bipolaricaulota bacterium]